MKISFCVGRSAPPDSTSEIVGRPFSSAIWAARKPFFTVQGLLAPPLTVGSLAVIRHSTPSTTPIPVTSEAPTEKSEPQPANGDELQERRPRVDEELDALAREQLPAGMVPVDVLLAPAADGLGVLGIELGELLEHGHAVAGAHGSGRAARAVAHCSTTAFIRSSVVRIPRALVRPRSGPSTSQ